MPSADTFSVAPIAAFVGRFLAESKCSVDPFARNSRLATFRNDLNPDTLAESHIDAGDFLANLAADGIRADLVILDAPYSPRQISECYRASGKICGMADTQNAALYSRIRSAVMGILSDNAVVLSFGWNSAGMGRVRDFEIAEIMLVAHGSAHNDTICMAERRLPQLPTNPPQP